MEKNSIEKKINEQIIQYSKELKLPVIRQEFGRLATEAAKNVRTLERVLPVYFISCRHVS